MIKLLRKKFVMINMIFVFIILTIVSASISISKYKTLQNESYLNLEMAFKRNNGPPPMFQIGEKPPKDYINTPVFVVRILPDNTPMLLYSDNISITEQTLKEITSFVLDSGKTRGILSKYHLRYMIRKEHGEIKIAFIDQTNEITSLRDIIISTLLATVIGLFAFLIVSIYLSKWVLRPTERAWEQQRQFIADASHELKTPLTVILANTGILKSHPHESISDQMCWIINTENEAVRMKKLIDNMLFLAKTDNSKAVFVKNRINLSDVVFNTTLTFESVAYEKKITIDMDVLDNVFITGDESGIRQLIVILLDNAIKYSDINGNVMVSLYVKNTKAYLKINNTGTPIAKDDLKHLFERFYQADKSRSPEGYGLGLSIAKSIVKSNNGEINVTSSDNDGTTFTVVFSCYTPSP